MWRGRRESKRHTWKGVVMIRSNSSSKWSQVTKAKPCEICGHDRVRNLAHIIPRSCGGPDDNWNLAHLCANHHFLFDHGRLTREEWDAIRWEEKGKEARYFADKVRRRQHEKTWSG